MSFLFNFLYTQWFVKLPYPTQDVTGQTIVVTGSNVGLGLEAARHFVRLNAEKVILAVRNIEKGEAAKKSIETSTQRWGVVEVWQLDLSSYESVKQFAQRINTLKRLDVLLENAGIATDVFKVAEDSESTITTNVISTFLLGLLALPKLRESAAKFNVTPYLTIVSSEVHFMTQFPERKNPDILRSLGDKETARMGDRYNVSKLLEVFFCRELAAHSKNTGKPDVIINFLNPGLCHSELARDMGLGMIIFKWILARSTEVGSRTLMHAAHAGPESHGEYLSDCQVKPPAPLVLSEDGAKTQKRVWDELSQRLESIQPGIMANV